MSTQSEIVQALNNLHDAASDIFRKLSESEAFEGSRRGCAITIGIFVNEVPVQITKLVGTASAEKAPKYMQLSTEKPTRTIQRGHRSSWESRDPENACYGGGFWFSPYYIGISGLTERDDDVLAMLISERLGLCAKDSWRTLMVYSGNEFRYQRMARHC